MPDTQISHDQHSDTISEITNSMLSSADIKKQLIATESLLKKSFQNNVTTESYLLTIRLCDTEDLALKKIVYFYLSRYNVDPNNLIMVVNTVLRDLESKDKVKIATAIDFVGHINFLDEYFLSHMLDIYKTESNPNLKTRIVNNLTKFFGNEDLIEKYKLKDVLKEAFFRFTDQNVLNAVQKLQKQGFILFKIDEIMSLFISRKLDLTIKLTLLSLIYDLCVLLINQMNIETIDKLCRFALSFLNNNIFEMLFIASKILYTIKPEEYSQRILDSLIPYCQLQNLNSFCALEFIRDIIYKHGANLIYENNDFLIYKNDFLNIKQMKIDILAYKIDEVSYKEFFRMVRCTEILFDLFRIGIVKSIRIEKIVEICEKLDLTQVINILYENNNFDVYYQNEICNMLERLNNVENLLHGKIMHILGYVAKDLILIQKFRFDQKSNEFLKMILHLFFRKAIDKDVLIELLKNNLLGKSLLCNQDRIFRDNIQLYKFAITKDKINFKTGTNFVYKCLMYKEKLPKNLQIEVYKAPNAEKKDNQKNICWSYDGFSYSIIVFETNKKLYFEITRLEVPLKIDANPYFKKIFNKPEVLYLCNAENLNDQDKIVFDVNESILTYTFKVTDFITNLNITIDEFNNNFNKITSYEIFELKLLKFEIYYIDKNIFSFRIFDAHFYGMVVCGQIILKCSKNDYLKKLSMILCKKFEN